MADKYKKVWHDVSDNKPNDYYRDYEYWQDKEQLEVWIWVKERLRDYFFADVTFSAATGSYTQLTLWNIDSPSNALIWTNLILVQKKWLYNITANCTVAANATWIRRLLIQKNWTNYVWGQFDAAASWETYCNVSVNIKLWFWDKIGFYIHQTSWSTLAQWTTSNKISVIRN